MTAKITGVEVLENELAALELQIAQLTEHRRRTIEAIRLLRLSKVEAEHKGAFRFLGKRPGNSAIVILTEHGSPMERAEVMRLLIEGGAILHKKRGEHNLRIAMDDLVASGRLKQIGTQLGLPEWSA